MPIGKYRPYQPIGLPDRAWPNRKLDSAPLWCSVDLRDGNQALLDPMNLARKRELFQLLVRLGFTEIEIGFPTSCQTDWDFVRELALRNSVPEHITVQVMSPMRKELIERTVKSLDGIPRAILQVFNPTSVTQRRVVFHADPAQVKALAVAGAEVALRIRDSVRDTTLALQYAPESFTQTEPEFALEVCNAVLELWQPMSDDDIRINLPATVENFPPQEFGDRIEWMNRNLPFRDVVTLSVHPHNDRGTAVAAAEIAVLAGADRVEGTLFGNGERTGNVCLITLAMNLFSQGIDPMLELGDIEEVRRVVERCTELAVPPRHPWGGDLVYTSFAGSHQDAIHKALGARRSADDVWDVPYLPIDPSDVGHNYKALIRINNQSGKGGISYVMRTEHGLDLPRRLQVEFSAVVQRYLDTYGGEVAPNLLWSLFETEYFGRFPGIDWPEVARQANDDDELRPAELLAQFVADQSVPVRLVSVTSQSLDTRAVWGTARHCCYCEVAVGNSARWGVGLGPTKQVAVAVALRRVAELALLTVNERWREVS
jgi:2-isopropylmalate synthase